MLRLSDIMSTTKVLWCLERHLSIESLIHYPIMKGTCNNNYINWILCPRFVFLVIDLSSISDRQRRVYCPSKNLVNKKDAYNHSNLLWRRVVAQKLVCVAVTLNHIPPQPFARREMKKNIVSTLLLFLVPMFHIWRACLSHRIKPSFRVLSYLFEIIHISFVIFDANVVFSLLEWLFGSKWCWVGFSGMREFWEVSFIYYAL